jgi:tetraacyldisaccharide 4'-kinase
MNFVRKILLPLVPLYYLVTWLRNLCFDLGILSSKAFDIPVICVGNLSTGGTGKTPMIEYLIRMIRNDFKVATLSRGYKRETRGFIMADKEATVASIGDEAFQFYQKFNDVTISVDGDRRRGIDQLLKLTDPPEVILLDDGFQHRRIKAGLNILLTAYDKLYTRDILLPTGNLREPRSGAQRAHIIVVTKCPDGLDAAAKMEIRNLINPHSEQKLFFGRIRYSESVYSALGQKPLSELRNETLTLVTGIADADPLLQHLDKAGLHYEHLDFKDHHKFGKNDLKTLNARSSILTTEKDYMRLKDKIEPDKLYYLPIETEISEPEDFKALIRKYIKG